MDWHEENKERKRIPGKRQIVVRISTIDFSLGERMEIELNR